MARQKRSWDLASAPPPPMCYKHPPKKQEEGPTTGGNVEGRFFKATRGPKPPKLAGDRGDVACSHPGGCCCCGFQRQPGGGAALLYAQYNASEHNSSWTPGEFYTYFYNHTRRLRLEKLLYIELSRSFNGYSKPLLDPSGGFRSEMAVTCNVTAILQRKKVFVWL
jgi:hypothetical protein